MSHETGIVIGSLMVLALAVFWGHTARAQQQEAKEVTLIKGLDGGDYEPCLPSAIERAQEALRAAGLYNREVNGILDQATMEAIRQFQEQNGLQACGVPTPRTRQLLLQPLPPEQEQPAQQ